MDNINLSKIIKSISFILFVSIFQPFFDIFLLFQYGPAASCIDCFILEQTVYISLLYIATPLTILYLLLKIINWNSIIKYLIIAILFALLSFYKLTLLLFDDRVAAWSTFSESEMFNSALIESFPTLLIQIILVTTILYKINWEKTAANSGNFTEPTVKNENQMKKLIAGITLILCLLLVTFTSVLGNLFSILTEKEYIIPKESSIFTFEATKMNEGSGGWWLYGEDNKKYYALSMDSTNMIINIDKIQSHKFKNFDKFDYKTWK